MAPLSKQTKIILTLIILFVSILLIFLISLPKEKQILPGKQPQPSQVELANAKDTQKDKLS